MLKAGIVFEFDRTGKKKIIDTFIFDLSRLVDTVEFMKKELLSVDVKEQRQKLRYMLDDILLLPSTPDTEEQFRTIVINYICTYNSPSDWIKKLPNTEVGFIFNVVDYEDNPKIMAVDMPSFKLMVEKTLK